MTAGPQSEFAHVNRVASQVLGGLRHAFADYAEGAEEAWRR